MPCISGDTKTFMYEAVKVAKLVELLQERQPEAMLKMWIIPLCVTSWQKSCFGAIKSTPNYQRSHMRSQMPVTISKSHIIKLN